MRTLFLYGGYGDNYPALSKSFAEASGSDKAKIALLLQNVESRKYIDGYTSEWRNIGVRDISPVMPDSAEVFIKNTIEIISNSTGIFVGGGVTSQYKEQYIDTVIRDAILQKYHENMPYAGLSAGAILPAEKVANYESEDFETYNGLGILKDVLIMPHFEIPMRKDVLLRFLKGTGIKVGLGIDSSICIKIIDERYAEVFGEGSCYVYKKTADTSYNIEIFNPRDKFEF